MCMNEKHIFKALQADKTEGFSLLVAEYRDMILNIAYSYTGNKDDSEDLTQEVLIKVYDKLDSFKGLSKLSTWLYKITINTCHDHVRRKKRMKIISYDQNNINLKSDDDFDKTTETRETQKLIIESILKLPLKLRDVIILKELEDKSYKDIAGILKCSIGTVESRLFRARQKLKNILAPEIKKGELL